MFIGASNDRRFRAFDSKTGKELWVTRLEMERARGAGDLSGQERQAVRGDCGGWRQRSRRRRPGARRRSSRLRCLDVKVSAAFLREV